MSNNPDNENKICAWCGDEYTIEQGGEHQHPTLCANCEGFLPHRRADDAMERRRDKEY